MLSFAHLCSSLSVLTFTSNDAPLSDPLLVWQRRPVFLPPLGFLSSLSTWRSDISHSAQMEGNITSHFSGSWLTGIDSTLLWPLTKVDSSALTGRDMSACSSSFCHMWITFFLLKIKGEIVTMHAVMHINLLFLLFFIGLHTFFLSFRERKSWKNEKPWKTPYTRQNNH